MSYKLEQIIQKVHSWSTEVVEVILSVMQLTLYSPVPIEVWEPYILLVSDTAFPNQDSVEP